MTSLYEQLGGQPAVAAAVEIFYRKILADERVSPFFDDVDIDKQVAKQQAFLTMVFGGPNNYTGSDMRKGHAHLLKRGLNDEHVDIIVDLLGQTLAELNVPAPLIQEVQTLANSVRNDVLSR